MKEQSIFERVVIHEAFSEAGDKGRFLAYMFLRTKHPNLTYWSRDGYSCDALADYTKMLVWRDDVLVDWKTKEVIKEMKYFFECSMTEIIDIWESV